MDFAALFALSMSPLELVIRGTALYWFLIFIFRVAVPRNIGEITIADVLLLVLIADASQNAMAGGYTSVTDGFVLIVTLVGWSAAFDWLAFRFPAIQKILEPPPIILIRHGRILHKNLRKEFMTVDELKAKLREHGIEDLMRVKAAYLESDGQFSVIEVDGNVSDKGGSTDNRVI
ncbi:DUF421 domain-containing protein [Chitinimonas sp. PSY-7]|uniref:YetF domain-containing protein n=1 Tax=Chitinimonas sp. PSY-7 TaxID=3459088 RepID=UPI00404019B9